MNETFTVAFKMPFIQRVASEQFKLFLMKHKLLPVNDLRQMRGNESRTSSVLFQSVQQLIRK